MGPTKVACVPRATFREHWASSVHFQGRLNRVLYHRMNNIQDDKTLITSPLRVRVANLLLRHLDQDSGAIDQPLSLTLTRQEIADALGVAVESVIRIMSEWQSDGTIRKTSDRGPEFLNIAKLLNNSES